MDKLPNLPNIKPELLDVPTPDKLAQSGDIDHPPLRVCARRLPRSACLVRPSTPPPDPHAALRACVAPRASPPRPARSMRSAAPRRP